MRGRLAYRMGERVKGIMRYRVRGRVRDRVGEWESGVKGRMRAG